MTPTDAAARAKAMDIVAQIEHGDAEHRRWLYEHSVPIITAALKAERERALNEAAECARHKRRMIEILEHVPDDRLAKASKAMCDEIENSILVLKEKP